jgi:hypothetical protein
VTYAVYWIRRAILRALAGHYSLVHVPCNRRRRARSVREAERVLAAETGRPPTPEEVRRRTGLSRRQIEDWRGPWRRAVAAAPIRRAATSRRSTSCGGRAGVRSAPRPGRGGRPEAGGCAPPAARDPPGAAAGLRRRERRAEMRQAGCAAEAGGCEVGASPRCAARCSPRPRPRAAISQPAQPARRRRRALRVAGFRNALRAGGRS